MSWGLRLLLVLGLSGFGVVVNLGQTFLGQRDVATSGTSESEGSNSAQGCCAKSASQKTSDVLGECCESQKPCCTEQQGTNSIGECCQSNEPTVTARKSADEFMLMMQGMAGIGPEDSAWVFNKLFEGFIPAPMPCCGPPGSKDQKDEHNCCENQIDAIQAAERASESSRAFIRFQEQFSHPHRDELLDKYLALGIGPSDKLGVPATEALPTGIQIPQHTADGQPVLTEKEWDKKFRLTGNRTLPGGYVQYLAGMGVYAPNTRSPLDSATTGDSTHSEDDDPVVFVDVVREFPEDAQPFRIVAADMNIVYNRFGGHDKSGKIYVLEEDLQYVKNGQDYFNAGHDPMFYGCGRSASHALFLKNPATGEFIDLNGEIALNNESRLRVLPVEPLVIRANVGQTVYVEFTNQLQVGRANWYLRGALYRSGNVPDDGSSSPLPKESIRYKVKIPDDEGAEGTYLFHSFPVISGSEKQGFELAYEQSRHGLFGALIVEPKGSIYLDSQAFDFDAGDDGHDVQIDPNSYQPLRSGWAAIIDNEDEKVPCFREHTIFFHDELQGPPNRIVRGMLEGSPRAIGYRTEPFTDILNTTGNSDNDVRHDAKVLFTFEGIDVEASNPVSDELREEFENHDVILHPKATLIVAPDPQEEGEWLVNDFFRATYFVLESPPDTGKYKVFDGMRPRLLGRSPFLRNDHSMAYSAYTFGDSSTPHPRFYVGDPMRYRVVHSGMGNEFHVFHHHAHRWRFQGRVAENEAENGEPNLTKTSKWGRIPVKGENTLFPDQPDVNDSTSIRIDSQTLGPGETFDVYMEGGAGGVQRTVGDVLLHCHIIDHVTRGMWTYARVFNTLQESHQSHQPGIAPLPDRLSEGTLPPRAVDSVQLAKLVKAGDGPKPVSGALAGKRITQVESELHPFIEDQLPEPGVPSFDKNPRKGDRVFINRADRWNWQKAERDGEIAYFGEPYGRVTDLVDVHSNGLTRIQETGKSDRPKFSVNSGHRFAIRQADTAASAELMVVEGMEHLVVAVGDNPDRKPKAFLHEVGATSQLGKVALPVSEGSTPTRVAEFQIDFRDDPPPDFVEPLKFGDSFISVRKRDVSPPRTEIVDFSKGFPTPGEGVGVRQNDADAPRLLFNPVDGRLAYPHLLPRAGRRPPFAPRNRLVPPEQPGKPWTLADEHVSQGTAYLGPVFSKNDPGRSASGEALGVEFGSGLAPEEAKDVKHYDVVALTLPINYGSPSGWGEANSFNFGTSQRETRGPRVLEFIGSGRAWKLDDDTSLAGPLQAGDTIEWSISAAENHGVRFSQDDDERERIRSVLEFSDNSEVAQSLDGGVPKSETIQHDGNGKLLLARATVRDGVDPDSIADITFDCNEHGEQMSGAMRFIPVPFDVDEAGQIFVLREDIPGILRGEKRAEPLVIRANAGDVVDITLSSALEDTTENDKYSKVGIHTHLVQYDVQSSDGAVAGLNYETSIRPSWKRIGGDIQPINGEAKYAETVHYRWWCDTELGMVYFHDHSLLKSSLPHGLFGATVVEPAGAEYLDPKTHQPVYAPPNDKGRITQTKSQSGIGVADIRYESPTGKKLSFREFVPIYSDASADRKAFNLRRNDMGDHRTGRIATRDRNGWPIYGPTDYDADDGFIFDGGPETLFSSRVHGDPVTPIWRSYVNDPVRVRTEGAGTHEIHGLNVHGKRWRYEPNNSLSTWRDFGLVGISEGFTFVPDNGTPNFPGDYWYGSYGREASMISGKWGLWRSYPSGSQAEDGIASGNLRIYIKQEDLNGNVTLRANSRFISSTGVLFRNERAVTTEQSVFEENQTAEIEGEQVFFFDVRVRAELPGEEANLPARTRFGIDVTGDGDLPKIVRIISTSRFTGGATPLKPIRGVDEHIDAEAITLDLLPTAQEAEIRDGTKQFDVAAIPVFRSINGETVPTLAFVPLINAQDRRDAITIRNIIREQGAGAPAADPLIETLQTRLTRQFATRPEPLVMRVAAQATPAAVAMRVFNLLPETEQLEKDFPLAVSTIGLHASLVDYHIEENDGSAVGNNRSSLIVRGDSRCYLWTFREELGACLLRDPHPGNSSAGLFAALIVEPQGSTVAPSAPGGSVHSCQVCINEPRSDTSFREFVLFVHDDWNGEQVAINYGLVPDTPELESRYRDPVRLRLIHAAGIGSKNVSLFVSGQRWPFDFGDPHSNRVAAISLAPSAVYNLELARNTPPGRYLYGSLVANQLRAGTWGYVNVLQKDDSTLHPLERSNIVASVSAPANETPRRPTRHVVTASSDSWIHGRYRSGDGEQGAVDVKAKPGDLVEFRQSDGKHGVMFYVTPLTGGREERGRYVVVDREFEEVAPGVSLKEFEFSSRSFDRRNLTTNVQSGRAELVTIRLKDDFKGPLFFACREHSILGQRRMFGRITLAPSAIERGTDEMQRRGRIFHPAKMGRVSPQELQGMSLRRGTRLELRFEGDKGELVQVTDKGAVTVTDDWFPPPNDDTPQEISELAPNRSSWYYAKAEDMDGDGDRDLIALIQRIRDDEFAKWHVFRSQSAEVSGSIEERTGFYQVTTVPIEVPLHTARDVAFCSVADIDNDQLPDLILQVGAKSRGRIRVSRAAWVKDREKRTLSLSYGSMTRVALPDVLSDQTIRIVAPGDVDFDGWIDLVLVADDGTAILPNNGKGQFLADDNRTLASSVGTVNAVEFVDRENSALTDILLRSNSRQQLWKYQPHREWNPATDKPLKQFAPEEN